MAIDVERVKRKYKEMKKKQEEAKSGGDFIDLEFKDNLIRILSPDDSSDFYREAGYHYLKDGKETKAVLCLKLAFGEACYFCEVVDALYKTKDKKDKELAKDLRGTPRIFFNILDRNDENKVKILAIGNDAFTQILGYMADEDWGDITHSKHGHDIIIEKVKTGDKKMDVKYKVRPKPKSTPVGVSDIEFHDLEAILEAPTYEEQQIIFEGGEVEKVEPDGKSQQIVGRRASVEPEEPEETEEDLVEKLDLTDVATVSAYKKWKKQDGSIKGLKKIVELFGDSETIPGEDEKENKEEPQDEIDIQIQAALDKYKKPKGKK